MSLGKAFLALIGITTIIVVVLYVSNGGQMGAAAAAAATGGAIEAFEAASTTNVGLLAGLLTITVVALIVMVEF